MFCQVCGCKKATIKDTRNDVERNETYRLRECKNDKCRHQFYTVEFEVDADNDVFKEQWDKMGRGM